MGGQERIACPQVPDAANARPDGVSERLARLRTIMVALPILAASDNPAVRDIADAFRRYLDRQVDSLDRAFEVDRAQGESDIRRHVGRLERNGLLAAAAERFGFTSMEITRRLGRYRAIVWPRTRLASECPHPEGSEQSFWWRCLALVDDAPGERRIRSILAEAKTSAPWL
jgi:hypothetical protein